MLKSIFGKKKKKKKLKKVGLNPICNQQSGNGHETLLLSFGSKKLWKINFKSSFWLMFTWNHPSTDVDKTSTGAIKSKVTLNNELHKPIIRKFKKM